MKPDKIQHLANVYARFKCNFSELPQSEIDRFRNEVETAFNRISKLINISFVGTDPYKDLAELTNDIDANKQMLISFENNNNKLLPDQLNLKFRAVHDFLHYVLQAEFDFNGEYQVYKAQKYMHKTETGKKILFSEVVLQASYCTIFNKFPEVQKIVII